jgi:hypothetical protein
MSNRTNPSADADRPAEATDSGWITRFLAGGDRLGRATLSAGQCGVEFRNGGSIVDNPEHLTQLGHALATHFDPPSTADLEAAGLPGDGPHTWPDVARAALTRPLTVYIADTATTHYDWVGTGFTEDEDRDSLMRAWLLHAEQTGADPDYIRRDELNVRHGVIGTGWRDNDAFPPPQRHP